MPGFVWVGIGGCVGAVARYAVGLAPFAASWTGSFPLTTFLINVVGSLVIGVVAGAVGAGAALPVGAVLFLKTGLCGGFTTFSTFSLETFELLEAGKYATGLGYAGLSCVCCVAGAAAGMALGRALAGR
jgi:CrcB protein